MFNIKHLLIFMRSPGPTAQQHNRVRCKARTTEESWIIKVLFCSPLALVHWTNSSLDPCQAEIVVHMLRKHNNWAASVVSWTRRQGGDSQHLLLFVPALFVPQSLSSPDTLHSPAISLYMTFASRRCRWSFSYRLFLHLCLSLYPNHLGWTIIYQGIAMETSHLKFVHHI